MKRARDIRDQLEGLLERVEIEPTSNPSDLEGIKKAITSGNFLIFFQVFFFFFFCGQHRQFSRDFRVINTSVSIPLSFIIV